MEEEKILKLNIEVEEDDWVGLCGESILDEKEGINFSVYNLAECPEDAIIGRGLFDAYDYVEALEKGMELARKGYTKIETIEIDSEE